MIISKNTNKSPFIKNYWLGSTGGTSPNISFAPIKRYKKEKFSDRFKNFIRWYVL